MKIPKPNEFAAQGGFKPFPPKWERWLDSVREAILSAQPIKGRHVTVDEQPGQGTVVNVDDTSTRRPTDQGIGACCYNDGTCDDLTEADCTAAEGNWQGLGTTCADDPNPCLGACCEGEGGTTCVDDSTPDSCAEDGGTFQDFGSTCDPNPCGIPASCCGEAFQAWDGSCRYFLTKTSVASLTGSATAAKCGGTAHGTGSVDTTDITTIDPDTCESSCEASGSLAWDVTVSGNGAPPAGEVHCYGTRSICGETSGHETTYLCDGTVSIDHDYTDFDASFGGYPFNHCVFTSGSSVTSETATERTTTFTGDFTGTFVETLSNEVSITGACCDFDLLTCSITTDCDCVCDGCSWLGACSICDECGF